MANLKMRFGHLLAGHRKQRRLKQWELGERASLSVDMIAKLETGVSAPSFASIERLADALKIDPAELFTADTGVATLHRRPLSEMIAALSKLTDAELRWVEGIIKAALEPRS